MGYATCCRRPVFGYLVMVLSMIATAFIGTVASPEPLWHPELSPPAIIGLACEKTAGPDGPARRRAGSPLQDARGLNVATADRHRHIRHVHLVDLSGERFDLGAIPTFVCLVGWFWPTGGKERLFGPIIVSSGLLLVGLIQFGEFIQAAKIAAAALAITSLEGWLLTPPPLGKAEHMHVVVVFLGVLLWAWIWGAWGTILAVPMLVIVKSIADHVDSLKPVSRLMSP